MAPYNSSGVIQASGSLEIPNVFEKMLFAPLTFDFFGLAVTVNIWVIKKICK